MPYNYVVAKEDEIEVKVSMLVGAMQCVGLRCEAASMKIFRLL